MSRETMLLSRCRSGESSVSVATRFVRVISREASGTNVAEEMVDMIQTQRAYEANSKAIKASDDMMGEANSLRR